MANVTTEAGRKEKEKCRYPTTRTEHDVNSQGILKIEVQSRQRI